MATVKQIGSLLEKSFEKWDYKGQFKIVVDEMPSKEICNLTIAKSTKSISIENNSYDLKNISTIELTKFKKKLVDSAIKFFKN